MYNKDVLDLYPRVAVGTKVTVTWQRFSRSATAAMDDDAQVLQEEAQLQDPPSWRRTIPECSKALTRSDPVVKSLRRMNNMMRAAPILQGGPFS